MVLRAPILKWPIFSYFFKFSVGSKKSKKIPCDQSKMCNNPQTNTLYNLELHWIEGSFFKEISAFVILLLIWEAGSSCIWNPDPYA